MDGTCFETIVENFVFFVTSESNIYDELDDVTFIETVFSTI